MNVSFHSDIPQVRAEMVAKADQVVRRAALSMKAKAQQAAPVDTGNLKSSAFVEYPQRQAAVIAFGAPYAIFVEKGHTATSGATIPGTHMLQKAFDATVPEMLKALEHLA